MNRREFLKKSVKAGMLMAGFTSALENTIRPLSGQEVKARPELFVAKNGTPKEMTRSVIAAMGGMDHFVKKGQTVVVKPNIGWDRTPELAANTNPEVVAEIVKMCYEVGAKKVLVLDRTCNEPKRCYLHSQIEEYAVTAGAQVRHIHNKRFKTVEIPGAKVLTSWTVYQDVLDADVLINVPIAKHHSMCQLSLGLKNLMGVMGGNRGTIHNGYDQKIVDFNKVVIPNLTIIDAYRTLMRNGPQGGNLADVRLTGQIIASVDRLAADTYAASLFNFTPNELPWLRLAGDQGLGENDISRIKVHVKDLRG